MSKKYNKYIEIFIILKKEGKFMESFTLREATKGDSEFIAELVYKTEDDPEHVWGYGSKVEIIDRIKWLVESEGSRYSITMLKLLNYMGRFVEL